LWKSQYQEKFPDPLLRQTIEQCQELTSAGMVPGSWTKMHSNAQNWLRVIRINMELYRKAIAPQQQASTH
ncbi:MAG: hypothetical protein AAB544_01180, partial [Patescibacteria group bacterium]